MDIITVLPHHARQISLAYNGVQGRVSYYDKIMEATELSNTQKILSDPNQQIQIVSGLDSLCNSCPYNKSGSNYDPKKLGECELSSGKVNDWRDFDRRWAKRLGLIDIMDKEPIPASEFLERMENAHPLFRLLKSLVKYIDNSLSHN